MHIPRNSADPPRPSPGSSVAPQPTDRFLPVPCAVRMGRFTPLTHSPWVLCSCRKWGVLTVCVCRRRGARGEKSGESRVSGWGGKTWTVPPTTC